MAKIKAFFHIDSIFSADKMTINYFNLFEDPALQENFNSLIMRIYQSLDDGIILQTINSNEYNLKYLIKNGIDFYSKTTIQSIIDQYRKEFNKKEIKSIQ
jgi:hypothetical protein